MTKKKKQGGIATVIQFFGNRWWDRSLSIVLFVIIVSMFAGEAYALTYRNKIFPGVFVGSVPVGGLTMFEAEQALDARIEKLRSNGLVFTYKDRNVSVPMITAATDDPDLSQELISYDTSRMVRDAFQHGRKGALDAWRKRLEGLFTRVYIDPEVRWEDDVVLSIVKQNVTEFENPAQNAQLVFKNGRMTITPETSGVAFNYREALTEAEQQLDRLSFTSIILRLEKEEPTLTAAMAEPVLTEAQDAVRKTGVRIVYDQYRWFWSATTINQLLEMRLATDDSHRVVLGIQQEAFDELMKPLVDALTIAPQEPRFKIENEKVVEFKTSTNGQMLDTEATLAQWEEILFLSETQELEPVVVVAEPEQRISDVNDLGITELLGTGYSSFAGSPSNRRHNIRVGAESVNGTIIPPGEEFSLLKTLGAIDETTGYLPELVIKGNKTVPEYGGGLCQIGTTTFRGTLASGLPITQRRNHSYSVSYYYDEFGLPGTDATIYDPAPDYRFKNDTQNHVLITTRIEGSELYFEFWGTLDGRTVEQSRTRVWDRTPPPPTKFVETLDLPVGEVKCTESPHDGIKAAFDYTVTYADGTVAEETFTSSYRPWQEVCLVGVEELSEEAEKTAEETASAL